MSHMRSLVLVSTILSVISAFSYGADALQTRESLLRGSGHRSFAGLCDSVLEVENPELMRWARILDCERLYPAIKRDLKLNLKEGLLGIFPTRAALDEIIRRGKSAEVRRTLHNQALFFSIRDFVFKADLRFCYLSFEHGGETYSYRAFRDNGWMYAMPEYQCCHDFLDVYTNFGSDRSYDVMVKDPDPDVDRWWKKCSAGKFFVASQRCARDRFPFTVREVSCDNPASRLLKELVFTQKELSSVLREREGASSSCQKRKPGSSAGGSLKKS